MPQADALVQQRSVQHAQNRRILGDISSGSPNFYRGAHSASNVTLWMYQISPEEEIIQARSRCYRYGQLQPLSLSFEHCSDTVDTGEFLQMTPIKDESLLELPRKRLRLSSTTESSTSSSPSSSPVSSVSSTPSPLQCSRHFPSTQHRRSDPQQKKDNSLLATLHAYGPNQLARTIDDIVKSHPELEAELRQKLAEPNLSEFEERLTYLRRAVYRAFPSVRWDTTRDSFCYRRVRVHLDVFKNACMDQLKRLVHSGSWDTVVRYVVMAWRCVYQLPVWDDPAHNKMRKQCFSVLAANCMKAVKQRDWSRKELCNIRQQLERCQQLSSEMLPCLRHVDGLLEATIPSAIST